MTKTRDDFSARTKLDLALRASYVCSSCKLSTVGRSDEAPDAVTMIGDAAQICAAAPGPGARRYDPTMTPEERSHIDNGIWLCASCGDLIHRDEKRFTADDLRRMKREHEGSRRIGESGSDAEGDLISIGRDIVAVDSIARSGPDGTRVRLSHFVSGSGRDLWSLNRDFGTWLPERRNALLNELGFGGLLADPPIVERVGRPTKCISVSRIRFRAETPQVFRPCPARMTEMFAQLPRRARDVFDDFEDLDVEAGVDAS